MIIPRYINEIISDVRGIKLGWYAMDEVGNLSTGPFSSHAECLGSIIQPAARDEDVDQARPAPIPDFAPAYRGLFLLLAGFDR